MYAGVGTYPGGRRRIADIRAIRGSYWHRACRICGKWIPTAKWSGFCDEHRYGAYLENHRVYNRNARIRKAAQEGRIYRPRGRRRHATVPEESPNPG